MTNQWPHLPGKRQAYHCRGPNTRLPQLHWDRQRCDDPSLVAVTYTAVFPHPPAAWSSGWPTRRPVLSAGRGAFNAMWSNSLSILVTPPCSTLHSQWNLMKWRWAEWEWDPQHRNGNTHTHVHYLNSGDQLHSEVWWMIEFLSMMDVCISKMLLCDGC